MPRPVDVARLGSPASGKDPGLSLGGTLTLLSCLFLSGVASLLYEVCWIRKAGLFFGSTTLALATVLAVFFLGLAIGDEVDAMLVKLPGDRERIRQYAVINLLDQLRQRLGNTR